MARRPAEKPTVEIIRETASSIDSDLLIIDGDQSIRYISPSLVGLLGYDEDELTGEQLHEYVHETDVSEVETLLGGTTDESRNAPVRIQQADGSFMWLEIAATEVGETDSEGYALEVWDVTEYRQNERKLAEFADLLEELHGVTNELYASNSVDGTLETIRDAAVEILGFDWCILAEASDSEFVVRKTSEGSPLSVGDRPLDTTEGAAGTAYQSRESMLVADTDQSRISKPTHEFIISSITIPVGSWGVFQALSTSAEAFDSRDLQLAETLVAPLATAIERFQQEQQLRESKTAQQRQRRQIEALHAVATEMKTAKTCDEVYEMTIEAVEEILSFDICIIDEREGDVLVPKAVGSDMSIEDYYEETPIRSSEYLGSVTYQQKETFIIDNLHEAGYVPAQSTYRSCISVPLGDWGLFQVASSEVAVFDDTDRRIVELLTEHTVAAVERIEREQTLEQHAAELERTNERLEQFASIVSHDLQNPLNVAMGYTDQTLVTGDIEYVGHISDALERMESIINDVLALAKQGNAVGEMTEMSLDEIVHDSWRQVPTEDASLTVADDVHIKGDPGRLAQLFENLFKNSVEHSSTSSRPGADDSVEQSSTGNRPGADDSVEHADPDVVIEVGVLADADGLYIEDDGPGIDEEHRDRIFEHGYTDSENGTGFGLSIVRQIVQAHGWEISVTDGSVRHSSAEDEPRDADNERSRGARFEITGVDIIQ